MINIRATLVFLVSLVTSSVLTYMQCHFHQPNPNSSVLTMIFKLIWLQVIKPMLKESPVYLIGLRPYHQWC
ncbi:hypothetical protein V6Z12_A06G079900 [Gossypium hirsutum]